MLKIVYFICVVKPHQTIWRNKRLLGRTGLSALLLVLVLMQSVPLTEVLAAGEMDCCKGMAKMSADACAGGVCMTRKPKPKPKPVEKICGAKKSSVQQTFFAELQNFHLEKANKPIFSEAKTDDLSKQPNVSSLDNPAFSRSCQSDCCLTSFNYRNHKGFIYLSEDFSVSQKPRPPTSNYKTNFSQPFVKVLKTLHRECKPRAPPQIFS